MLANPKRFLKLQGTYFSLSSSDPKDCDCRLGREMVRTPARSSQWDGRDCERAGAMRKWTHCSLMPSCFLITFGAFLRSRLGTSSGSPPLLRSCAHSTESVRQEIVSHMRNCRSTRFNKKRSAPPSASLSSCRKRPVARL